MKGMEAEADVICKASEPTVIVVEHYENFLPLLEQVAALRSPFCRVVVTSRTSSHVLAVSRLHDAFGGGNVTEYDLNRLSDREVASLATLLESLGLWGQDAGFTDERKRRFIIRDCHRALRAVLMRAFEAPHIRTRMHSLFDSLRGHMDVARAIIGVCLLQVMGIPVTEYEVFDVVGGEVMNRPSFRSQPAVAEVLSFRDGRVAAKSPVLAEIVLKEFVDSDHVLGALLDLTRIADERRFDGGMGGYNPYKRLLRECIRFGSLQRMFHGADRYRRIFEFYELARRMVRVRRHPHYWLQYAVARLANGDLEIAGQYFDSAYAIARRIDRYDTSYIDNHFARYLLARAIEETDAEEAFKRFKKASQILRKQAVENVHRHYPFRVASVILDVVDEFGAQWDERKLRKVSAFIGNMSGAVRALPRQVRESAQMSKYGRKLDLAQRRVDELLKPRPSA